jgi:hypothetical protein
MISLYQAMDKVRSRFGMKSLRRAVCLQQQQPDNDSPPLPLPLRGCNRTRGS